jgi:hypothetical protein
VTGVQTCALPISLDGGRIGFAGTVPEMHANDALRRAYFGLR